MATVLFSTMSGELNPHVPGVPNPVMISYIRKVVIDLCNRGLIWRVPLGDTTCVAGSYSYTLASPVTDTEVVTILNAKVALTTAATTKNLDILSDDMLRAIYPTWPDTAHPSEPRSVARYDAQSFVLAPVPDSADTYTVKLFAAIRPTLTATGWEGTLFAEFRRAIFHGVLHELMMMPDRPWSNDKLALYHGKQWEYFLFNAKARANKGFGTASIGVKMSPWA
jgi:hypothetical protein